MMGGQLILPTLIYHHIGWIMKKEHTKSQNRKRAALIDGLREFKVSRGTRPVDDDDEREIKHKSSIKKLKHKEKKFDDEPISFVKKETVLVFDPKKSKKKKTARNKLASERSKLAHDTEDINDVIEKVKQDLERNKPKDDNDYRLVYLDMFTKQRKIIRRTEKKLLVNNNGGGREIYQLAAMYSQLRETIADLRSISDLSEHAERIVDLCMKPLFTNMVQKATDAFYTVKVKLKDKIKDKLVVSAFETIDEATIELGREMQMQYDMVSDKIRRMMTDK
jgi:hypothetical protein